jgi:hypothetical protein
MSRTTVIRSESEEVHRRVVNHAGRGDQRRPVTKLEMDAEKLSMEELRAKSDEEMRELNWNTHADTEYLPLYAVFAKRHPELRKHHDHNSTAIIKELETPEGLAPMNRAGRLEPNFWDLEMATTRALAKGNLRLDETAVGEQRIAAIEKELEQRDQFDPETMPLHQLRALANGYDPLGPK